MLLKIKKFLATTFLALASMAAFAQGGVPAVTPDNATNIGQWADGVLIAWACPKTGPVFTIPFTVYAPDGTPYNGFVSCGVDDGSKYEKPKSPTEKDI